MVLGFFQRLIGMGIFSWYERTLVIFPLSNGGLGSINRIDFIVHLFIVATIQKMNVTFIKSASTENLNKTLNQPNNECSEKSSPKEASSI